MLRILFIGNSHTYLHHMPRMLVRLAAAGGCAVHTEQATGEGAGLAWHWHHPETRRTLQKGNWSHVVLQERSRGALDDRVSMFQHVRRFDAAIRAGNARTVLYMTWPSRQAPQNLPAIADAYESIGRECGAMVAPVGKAWRIARERMPEADLYHRDGRHAGKAGAYLAACVFYGVISGKSPLGLPEILFERGRLLADLKGELAAVLQQAAFDAVTAG